MSQENVDIISSMYRRFNETGDLTTGFALLDADVEFEISWRTGRESPDFQLLRGVDAVTTAIRDFLAPFEAARYQVHEIRDAGDEVVVILELLVRHKDSAAEISTGLFAYIFTLRDGRIVRVQDFPEPAEALEAAGLSD